MKGFIFALFALLVLTTTACGGGTSGTSPTSGGGGRAFEKVLQGIVTNTSGAAVAGATVTVVNNGDSTSTNDQGRYSIRTELPETNASIKIEGQGKSELVTLSQISDADSVVQADVALGSNTSRIETFEFILEHIGDGACEGVFAAPAPIEFQSSNTVLVIANQIRSIPGPVLCTLHVRAFLAGLPYDRAGVSLIRVRRTPQQAGDASPAEPQSIVAQGETGTDGRGVLSFEFPGATQDYFVLEAPLQREPANRVGIVISPLLP